MLIYRSQFYCRSITPDGFSSPQLLMVHVVTVNVLSPLDKEQEIPQLILQTCQQSDETIISVQMNYFSMASFSHMMTRYKSTHSCWPVISPCIFRFFVQRCRFLNYIYIMNIHLLRHVGENPIFRFEINVALNLGIKTSSI